MFKRFLLLVPVLVLVATAVSFLWPPWRSETVLRLPGVVEIQEVRPGSKIGGRVAAVAVREGSGDVIEGLLVEPGQWLVRLDIPELEAQRDQARARLDAAQAALDKAEKGPRDEEIAAARATFESARAAFDRMEAGWRAEEKRQAKADAEAAEVDLRLARQEFDRINRLYWAGTGLGRSEYDAAKATVERSQGKYESAKAKIDMYMAGNRPEDRASARAALAKAQADLDLLVHGTRPEDKTTARANVAEARGKLDELEANIREAVIRVPQPTRSEVEKTASPTPDDRYVVEILSVREGDLLAPNTPVARLLLRSRDQWVKVYVPEPEIAKIQLGQEVDVTIDPYPKRLFKGRVTQIATVAEFTPRNVQSLEGRRSQVFAVKVRVSDPEALFKSGMAAEVRVPLPPAHSKREPAA